ncbi:hypothetical protein G7054_g1330 [Neopestalotiopsis clavispora]|nr:hypothetical protein G7054_g1330 [Neopestalotiopsis clavispora]
MVPSKPEIRVITLEDNSWAYTDVPYRALRSHVEEHLKALYPWVRDTRKNLMIRKYKIETLPNGDHRIWAAKKLPDDVVRSLVAMNQKEKTFD